MDQRIYKLISFKIDKKNPSAQLELQKFQKCYFLGVPNFLFNGLIITQPWIDKLLPIPYLDGYILMYFTEFILGRPINQKYS